VLRKVRWYQHYPASWVFHDLGSANWKTAVKAFSELERRLKTDALSRSNRQQLVDLCLAEQAREPMRLNPGGRAIRLLGELYQTEQLSASQRQALLENSCLLSATARPTVVLGDPCPLRLRHAPRFPPGLRGHLGVWIAASAADEPQRVDGHEFAGGVSTPMCGTYWLSDLPVGKHEPLVITEFTVYEGDYRSGPLSADDVAVHQVRREFRLKTVVFPEQPPGYITFTKSADIDQAVRSSVGPVTVGLDSRSLPGTQLLHVRVGLSAVPPLGLAFEVTVLDADGHRLRGAPCAFSPAEGRVGRSLTVDFRGKAPAAVTVILRPNEAAARRTADLFEIWDGELRFENVAVEVDSWP